MTQEEKELLIKDLSDRVPYGVKYMRYSWDYDTDQELPVIETLECVDKDGYINHERVYTVNDIKPYLFPLSSMTDEQLPYYITTLKYSEETRGMVETPKSFDWLNKNHFDYRGLIPMGIAKDATGLNIY